MTTTTAGSAFVQRETIGYDAAGMTVQYKVNVNEPLGVCFPRPMTFKGDSTKDWRYRHGAGGLREQRRLYYSSKGDSCNCLHEWTYYLRGASSEVRAVWTGRQTADIDTCGNSGRRVVYYPVEYLGAGGGHYTRDTNGRWRKEFRIQDYQGSIRAIVRASGNTNYNYTPYGAQTVNNDRWSFLSQEKDKETVGLNELGYRKYQSETGSFLRPDPLWSSSPGMSSYVYGNSSPLVWIDPQGLENEKPVHQTETAFCDAFRYVDGEESDNLWRFTGTYARGWTGNPGGGGMPGPIRNSSGYAGMSVGRGGGQRDKDYMPTGSQTLSPNKNSYINTQTNVNTRVQNSIIAQNFPPPTNAEDQARAYQKMITTNETVDFVTNFSIAVNVVPYAAVAALEMGIAGWTALAEAFGAAQTNPQVRQQEAAVAQEVIVTSRRYSEELVREAQELYPKLAGRIQLHHPIPQYLGGPKNQTLVPLDGAYHQQITNAFRSEWGYGIGKPSADQLQEIMYNVYNKYPLP